MTRHTGAGRLTRAVASIAAATFIAGGLLAAPASGAGVTPAAPASGVGVTAGPVPAQQRVETNAAQFEDRILQLLNRDRRDKGLSQLTRVTQLDTVARNWSTQQARERRMYHNPRYFEQYPGSPNRGAENVAMGYPTPEAMYRGWYNSSGHYRNMFDPDVTHIGIGIAYDRDGLPYGTQNFAAWAWGTPDLTTTPRPGDRPALPPIPGDDGSSTRAIDDGGVGGSGNEYHLTNGYSGNPDYVFRYGNSGGRVYVGDWDGDGRDTLAYRIGNAFYIRDSNSAGRPTTVVHYGRPGDRIYVGDWNGDGRDTFAVRRGSVYHIKNTLTGGDADHVINYGRAGDDVLVGDWDGDGRDTLAVRRGSIYHIKNAIRGGAADNVVNYGRTNDDVYAGDWDGDGRDTLMVRRDRTYYLKNVIRGGDADITLKYGRDADTTLVGNWSGSGGDGLGIRR